MNTPPNVIESILRQVSQWGPIPGTKAYKVPAIGTSVAIAASAVSPTVLQAPPLQWRESGFVCALKGSEQSGTGAKFAKTGIRIQIGGQEDLWTDGNSGVDLTLLTLFGGGLNWLPLWRRVIPGVNWVVSWYNYDPAAVVYPEGSFLFIADADLARMARGGA